MIKTTPTFLYPTSTKFPFDGTVTEIVHELEARNFRAPGMNVELDTFGTGEAKYRKVYKVTGDKWELLFGRKQRLLPCRKYNDTAAVTRINIPGEELSVYHDESGPTYYRYVGTDWERDADRFLHSTKLNSKLNGERRWYLKYKGAFYLPGSRHFGIWIEHQRPPYLLHDSDLNREYSPEGDAPQYMETNFVMKKFALWLQENVLAPLKALPTVDPDPDLFRPADEIPFPTIFGPIFTLVGWDDIYRIQQGQRDPSTLEPSDRFALQGTGYRLAPSGVRNENPIPEIAYEGFLWCGVRKHRIGTDTEALTIPGDRGWRDRERYIVRIMPRAANDIYIADFAPANAFAQQLRKQELSEEELRKANIECQLMPARTLVPIAEYRGGYTDPVVLIRRELSFDEVEIITAPEPAR